MDEVVKKVFTAVIVILYIISPIDLFPGPVDDAIVALIGWGISKN